MENQERRKHERVETLVKLKIKGDVSWVECSHSNVSEGGLLFESKANYNVGTVLAMQLILSAKDNMSNTHFFISGEVMRSTRSEDKYLIAVKFINVNEEISEALRRIIVKIKALL